MKTKKSEMSMNVLVILIVILLGAIVMGVFIYELVQDMGTSGDLETCRESILLASTGREIIGDPAFQLKCDRQELLIKKNDVVEDGIVNQEKVSAIMLDAMAECWYMMGEGKLDPFTMFDSKGVSYCLVCKQIKFDDSLQTYLDSYEDSPDYDIFKHSLLQPEFSSYSKLMPGKTNTYFEYFGHWPVGFDTEQSISILDQKITNNAVLGISGLKTEEYTGWFDINALERNSYTISGAGYNRENALILSLFLVQPLSLRDYDITGVKVSQNEDSLPPICKIIVN